MRTSLFQIFSYSSSHCVFKMTLGGGDQLCSYLMYGGAASTHSRSHSWWGWFKACPSFHSRGQQVHKLTEERAINGHIVCVLRRTMTPGTHSFVCLLAVAQPASAPLNLKDTMGSPSLSIHIFGIRTKMNFHLSSRENKDPWISCRIWRWFPQTIKRGWTSLVNLPMMVRTIICS